MKQIKQISKIALNGARLGQSIISKIDSTKKAIRTVDHMEFNNTIKKEKLVK